MKSTHLPRRSATSAAALALAQTLALGLALAGGQALAQSTERSTDRSAAVNRALAHVKAFPGRSLHGEGHDYEARDVLVDADGREHVRLARSFRGLPVIGGDLVVHSDRNGALLDTSRTLNRAIALDIRARIGAAEAVRAAVLARPGAPEGMPRLVVYARGDAPQLAYHVRLHGEQTDGTPSELQVMVDATSGAILESWDEVHTAPAVGTGKTLFAGNVPITTEKTTNFTLTDNTRGGGKTLNMRNRTAGSGVAMTDADNVWGNNATSDVATVAADAHYGIALTWDYFKNVHGRSGIANDGKGAAARVHYGRNYANAYWSDSCFCMTFGDGNGSSIKPLVSIDVAGHEMTHGVTSRTAGLVYSGESGGLNEATSDIFGTMVEYYANNAQDLPDYLMGEKLFTNGTSVIRNMMKPSSDGVSADCWYSGVGSIDVHYSSGIANHFFFLLAEGTTAGSPSKTCVAGNTKVASGNGTLTGIGRSKSEKIWYRALTVYMTSSTNYAAARVATVKAANDLYGAGSAEATAVADAWTAVLVN